MKAFAIAFEGPESEPHVDHLERQDFDCKSAKQVVEVLRATRTEPNPQNHAGLVHVNR
jgi:hypothetical protein